MPNNVKNMSSTKYCLKDYKIIVKIHYFLIFFDREYRPWGPKNFFLLGGLF